MPGTRPSPATQRIANKWGARLIPVLLAALVGYATWVVVVLIGGMILRGGTDPVNYLLHPPSGPRRRGAGIAIITIYAVLLLCMATAYLRVLQVIAMNPGLVPLPAKQPDSARSNAVGEKAEQAEKPANSSTAPTPDSAAHPPAAPPAPPPGLDRFYRRDLYECELDGMPRWCSSCRTWKPDRAHHSSEVGRCVYKMDHFCPWAGGIISETSFKFFVQFCCYGACWNLFNLIVVAYHTAQRKSEYDTYDANWIVVAALSGVFFSFSWGMAFNSLQGILHNSTTVDSVVRSTRVYYFAALVPPEHPVARSETARRLAVEAGGPLPEPVAAPYPTITFPLAARPTAGQSAPQHAPVLAAHNVRVFAVLATQRGSNPYLLDSRMANFKATMGSGVLEWLLPLRYSPCLKRRVAVQQALEEDGTEHRTLYELGPAVPGVLASAGITAGGPAEAIDANGAETGETTGETTRPS